MTRLPARSGRFLLLAPALAACGSSSFVGAGTGLAVANSDRFLEPNTDQTVMILDTTRALPGGAGGGDGGAIVAEITVGAFPREISADSTDLFVTNYDSSSISGIALSGLPLP
jgi:hypothetical protein